MEFNISSGKQKKAQKIVLYGPEGIGKSTFASTFPNPLFIDTEGSTTRLDVKRFDKPLSWTMLLQMVKYVRLKPEICDTLVIDTADWAEQLAIKQICDLKKIDGIEDIGYGKGYVYVADEFGNLLNLLSDVIEKGVNVVILAHAQMRKFEQPDEMGAYDRWELKLQKKTAPLLKEWADCLLFANYRTTVMMDSKTKSRKAVGGERVMYVDHHPAWDAKNRYGWVDVMPLSSEPLMEYLIISGEKNKKVENNEVIKEEKKEETKVEVKEKVETKVENVEVKEGVKPFDARDELKDGVVYNEALAELMKANKVGIDEVERVVSQKGYYPEGTSINTYGDDFVNAVLVCAWDQVFECIKENRK